MKQTIFLDKGKQLSVTTDEFTVGTLHYKINPGEQPSTPTVLQSSQTLVIPPENFGRNYEIQANRSVTMVIGASNISKYTETAQKEYTEDGELDTEYGISILTSSSSLITMTLPEPTDESLTGRLFLFVTGSTHLHDIVIAGTGHKFFTGGSVSYDALGFPAKLGANVGVMVIDGRWVTVTNRFVVPYNN